MTDTDRQAAIPQGKYEILGRAATGGMGEIFKVRHRLLGELRAVKVIRDLPTEDPKLQQRFLLEAKLAAALRHPNLAQIYDLAFSEDGTPHMVLEWIDGLDLERILRRVGRLPLDDALEIARQALSALAYLHGQGVVHRDVSAANLMVTRSGDGGLQAKLIDLGIAKSVKSGNRLTRKGLFAGKLHYAAPETLGGAKRSSEPDPRSDLYSFGVLLYEMLTGTGPIAGSSESELISGHLLLPPRPFAETDPEARVPEALRALLLRSLEKDPDDRFQSADELAAALEAARASAAAAGEISEPGSATDLLGGWRESLAGTPLGGEQGELDRTFGPESPGGSVAMEAWFEGMRDKYRHQRRRESSFTSTVARVVRRYPKRVAVGGAAVVLIAVIGLSGLLSGGQRPETAGEQGRGASGPPGRAGGETAARGPAAQEEVVAEPAAGGPAVAPRRAVALISDSPQLTSALLRELGPGVEVVMRESLREAMAAAGAGGGGLALRLSASASQISVEAYDTLLPSCEAMVAAEVLALPDGRSLFTRTAREGAPRCGEALERAGRQLAGQVAPRLRELL